MGTAWLFRERSKQGDVTQTWFDFLKYGGGKLIKNLLTTEMLVIISFKRLDKCGHIFVKNTRKGCRKRCLLHASLLYKFPWSKNKEK